MAFISPSIDIILIVIGLASVSQIIQRKLVDRKKIKADQKKMKEKQKKIRELAMKSDPKSRQEMQKLEKELFELMGSSMQGSMRMMMFSLPLFLLAFWFLGANYGEAVFPLPIPIPWMGQEVWWQIEFYNQTNWLGWYFLTYLIVNLLISSTLNIVEKMRQKGEKNANTC